MSSDVTTNLKPVAVVSGGSSGIGKAFVAALHKRGYVVVTCGRDPDKLKQLEAEFPGVEGHGVDVSNAEEMRKFVSAVLSAHPKIDLLISNAGGLREIDFTSDTLATLDLTSEIRINLEGAIYLISGFHSRTSTRGPRVDHHRELRLRPGAGDPRPDLFRLQGCASQPRQIVAPAIAAARHLGDRSPPARCRHARRRAPQGRENVGGRGRRTRSRRRREASRGGLSGTGAPGFLGYSALLPRSLKTWSRRAEGKGSSARPRLTGLPAGCLDKRQRGTL